MIDPFRVTRGVEVSNVKDFWNKNPLCASAVPYPIGTREYFQFYDNLREVNETVEFCYDFYEYKRFKGLNVLDVGSGNGYLMSRYALEGAHVHGIDITEVGVDLCRKRFQYMGLPGDFNVASAESIPYDNDSFDLVVSTGVLHHTPDTPAAVKEIFRVLKPGGRFITMFYYRDSLLYRYNFAVRSERQKVPIQQLVNEVDGVGNPKGDVYSKAELLMLLRDFSGHQMQVGLLQDWMLKPEVEEEIPPYILKFLEKSFGWFLYAKCNKPH